MINDAISFRKTQVQDIPEMLRINLGCLRDLPIATYVTLISRQLLDMV